MSLSNVPAIDQETQPDNALARDRLPIVKSSIQKIAGYSGRTSAIAFTLCRYVVYSLMLLRSLLAARSLGPYLLGIFGFISLLLQYLTYTGMGLQFAVNVEVATQPALDHRDTLSTAVTFTLIVAFGIVLLGFTTQTFALGLFPKYSFHRYAALVGVIAGSALLQQVYTNIYRVYGRLAEIAIAEAVSAIVLLICTLVFHGDVLITALLIGLASSGMFAILLFAARAPLHFHFVLRSLALRKLLKIGLPLLLYNASFYLITLGAQTVVSIYYPLVAMGYYTLANGIANVALLGFSSISWIVYPRILQKTRAGLPVEEVTSVTDRVNIVFGTGVFLLVFAVILCLPVLFLILPNFKPAGSTLTILLISQALLQGSFGFNCLAIARQKQMAVAIVSLLSVGVVTILATIVGASGLSFIWIAISVLAGSICFTALQARIGHSLLGGKGSTRTIVTAGTYTSIALCILGVLIHRNFLGSLVASVVFLVTSRNRIQELFYICLSYLRPNRRGSHKGDTAVETLS